VHNSTNNVQNRRKKQKQEIMERIRETLREDGGQILRLREDGGQNLEILERLQRLENGMGVIQQQLGQLLELSNLGVVNTDP
jgi:hypothetical protein